MSAKTSKFTAVRCSPSTTLISVFLRARTLPRTEISWPYVRVFAEWGT